jgi:hypothetical protein
MKKASIIILLLSSFIFITDDISAQSFWKKLGKNLEKAGKEVLEAVTEPEAEAETKSQNNDNKIEEAPAIATANTANVMPAMSGITISTPHRNLVLKLNDIQLSDRDLILDLTLTNMGEDIKEYYLYGTSSMHDVKVFDNLGNECKMAISFGNYNGAWGGNVHNTLLSDVPVKIRLTVSGLSSRASSLSLIRLFGEPSTSASPFPCKGSFILKNIPIGDRTPSSAITPNPYLQGMSITTPHRNLSLSVNDVAYSDNNLVLECIMLNRGDDLNRYYLYGTSSVHNVKVFDNLGNECKLVMTFGAYNGAWSGNVHNALFKDIPIKLRLTITGFGANATSLSQIRLFGKYDASDTPFACNGNFIIKNVPIGR